MDVFPAALGTWLSGFGKNQSGHSGFSNRLIGFGLKREQRQEHRARTGITVKCRPHGTRFFPPSVSINIILPPPNSSFFALSPAISSTYAGSSPLPLCGKCNPNHSWSATMGICPSLSHHDGLDEVGGGGHTDWECLLARVCVSQSVRQPDVQ